MGFASLYPSYESRQPRRLPGGDAHINVKY